jgi:hypothetical protein
LQSNRSNFTLILGCASVVLLLPLFLPLLFSVLVADADVVADVRLKNKEVLDVLQRFQELGLESSPEVQSQPQSGQLLLYDRAVVKYFRRDQHEWKKKRFL